MGVRPVTVGFLTTLWLLCAAGSAVADPWPGLQGIWAWGTLWNSHDTPFLRIIRNGNSWSVQTKHYMHANFMDKVRDVRIDAKHLEFSYWYEPRQRWAHCAFRVAVDTMAGFCDSEISTRDWGRAPSYLWLQPALKDASP
jgi:hypothetical protein